MSNALRRAAVKTFADWLEDRVPALAGRIHTVSPEPNEHAKWPCATISHNSLMFEPFQAFEVWGHENETLTVQNVGEFTGSIELRLFARAAREREDLEDLVMHELIGQEDRPGVVTLTTPAVTVGGRATLYAAPVAFFVDDAEWNEEFAFENRRFSFIDLDLAFPALVARDLFTIQELHVAITYDLESDEPEETIILSDPVAGSLATTGVNMTRQTVDRALYKRSHVDSRGLRDYLTRAGWYLLK